MPPRLLQIIRVASASLAALVIGGCAVLSRPTPSEADFAALQPGMSSQAVLAKVGRPTWVFGVWQDHMSIWNYRYNHNDCIIYQVSVLPDGTVRDAAPGWDPACDGPSHD